MSTYVTGIVNSRSPFATPHAVATDALPTGTRGWGFTAFYARVYRAECGRTVFKHHENHWASPQVPVPYEPDSFHSCKTCDRVIRSKNAEES